MYAPGAPPRISRHNLMPVAILVLLNVLHLVNVKTFVPWSQVTRIWSSDLPLLAYAGHFHFYRTLIASPGLWLEDIWPEHGFSLYVSLFLFLVSLLLVRIQILLSGRAPQLWAWFLLLALFMLMNGRGAIGWAGWILCVHACLGAAMGVRAGLSLKTVCQCFLGLSFATVSSGVLVASVALIVYFVFAEILHRRRKHRWRMSTIRLIGVSLVCIAVPILGYFVFHHLLDAVEKNLNFYGGGLEGMMGIATHGIASQIEKVTTVHVLSGGLVLLFAMLFALSHYRKRIENKLLAAIMIPVFGGIFGITILTLSFPLIIIATGTLFRFHASFDRMH